LPTAIYDGDWPVMTSRPRRSAPNRPSPAGSLDSWLSAARATDVFLVSEGANYCTHFPRKEVQDFVEATSDSAYSYKVLENQSKRFKTSLTFSQMQVLFMAHDVLRVSGGGKTLSLGEINRNIDLLASEKSKERADAQKFFNRHLVVGFSGFIESGFHLGSALGPYFGVLYEARDRARGVDEEQYRRLDTIVGKLIDEANGRWWMPEPRLVAIVKNLKDTNRSPKAGSGIKYPPDLIKLLKKASEAIYGGGGKDTPPSLPGRPPPGPP
jgi:hypothetical protein